jgi:hypothetical protein
VVVVVVCMHERARACVCVWEICVWLPFKDQTKSEIGAVFLSFHNCRLREVAGAVVVRGLVE